MVRERYWLTFAAGEIRVCANCHGINTTTPCSPTAAHQPPEALQRSLASGGGRTSTTATPAPTPTRQARDRDVDANGNGVADPDANVHPRGPRRRRRRRRHAVADADANLSTGLTPTSTPTPTPTRSPTATSSPTRTPSATPTPSPSPTPSPVTMQVDGLVTYYSNSDPVSSVEVHGTGAANAMALTNLDGEFGFSGLPGGDFQIEPRKIGGDNGAISSLDAAYALQAAVKMRTLTPEQIVACDVTGNGLVTALDAARILQRVVGRISTLPVAASCGSDWAFLPDADVMPHQTVTDPIVTAGSCQAGAITFTPLDADAQRQDFRAVLFGDCTGSWRPAGSAAFARRSNESLAHLGRPRRRGGEIVAPLVVDRADPFHAFEATLTFDPARLRSVRVQIGTAASGAVLQVNSPRDGRLTVALASAEPVDPTKGAILEVIYELIGRDHRVGRVRIVDVSLDE